MSDSVSSPDSEDFLLGGPPIEITTRPCRVGDLIPEPESLIAGLNRTASGVNHLAERLSNRIEMLERVVLEIEFRLRAVEKEVARRNKK